MPNTKPNKDAEEFGRRLVALLERHGQPRRGAGAYLSRRYRVSNVVANAWLNGEYKPEIPKSKEIADDHGEPFDALYFGDEPAVDDAWADVIGYVQHVGAGAGTEVQEYAETHALKFKAASLRRKGLLNRRLAVYYAKGDSMEPRIHTGDAILFDQDDTAPHHDAIYIVRWRGEEFVKRAKVIDDLVLFESDNPSGDHVWGRPKRMDNPRDPIEIIGRVRWIGSWED